jgi:hypothetical protein
MSARPRQIIGRLVAGWLDGLGEGGRLMRVRVVVGMPLVMSVGMPLVMPRCGVGINPWLSIGSLSQVWRASQLNMNFSRRLAVAIHRFCP